MILHPTKSRLRIRHHLLIQFAISNRYQTSIEVVLNPRHFLLHQFRNLPEIFLSMFFLLRIESSFIQCCTTFRVWCRSIPKGAMHYTHCVRPAWAEHVSQDTTFFKYSRGWKSLTGELVKPVSKSQSLPRIFIGGRCG